MVLNWVPTCHQLASVKSFSAVFKLKFGAKEVLSSSGICLHRSIYISFGCKAPHRKISSHIFQQLQRWQLFSSQLPIKMWAKCHPSGHITSTFWVQIIQILFAHKLRAEEVQEIGMKNVYLFKQVWCRGINFTIILCIREESYISELKAC